jgi:hypothetical protein
MVEGCGETGEMENFGNLLNRIINGARALLFDQAELAELTYGAFDIAAAALRQSPEETITISFPVGWRADNQAMPGTRSYKKDGLIGRYQLLAFQQLPVNSLIQIVIITEAMLADIVRFIVLKYPQKLGVKRTLPMQMILESASLDDIHLRATDALLNELSYKSPSEFADEVKGLLGVNLLECPAFHRYVEIKATRDIFIHNRGVANSTYARKAASHARVQAGIELPVNIQYFMQSYEACLQLTEWLEKQMHDHWHSSEFEDRQRQYQLPLVPPPEPPPSPIQTHIPPEEPVLRVPALEPPPDEHKSDA